jgi:hypothetical protein
MRDLVAGKARHVARVVNSLVDEVDVERPGALDQREEPPLVQRQHVEPEERQPEKPTNAQGSTSAVDA